MSTTTVPFYCALLALFKICCYARNFTELYVYYLSLKHARRSLLRCKHNFIMLGWPFIFSTTHPGKEDWSCYCRWRDKITARIWSIGDIRRLCGNQKGWNALFSTHETACIPSLGHTQETNAGCKMNMIIWVEIWLLKLQFALSLGRDICLWK